MNNYCFCVNTTKLKVFYCAVCSSGWRRKIYVLYNCVVVEWMTWIWCLFEKKKKSIKFNRWQSVNFCGVIINTVETASYMLHFWMHPLDLLKKRCCCELLELLAQEILHSSRAANAVSKKNKRTSATAERR